MSERKRLRGLGKLLLANLAVWLALEGVAWVVLLVIEEPTTTNPAGDGSPSDKDWLVQARLSFEGGLYVWDEHCLWRLQPGYEGGVDPNRPFWGDGPLRINEHGMRGPSTTLEKPPGVRRILVLGGSHPMGMYVNLEQSYGAALGRLLRELTGEAWEVLNAAAPGHTSFQGRQYLAHYGVDFAPDIVLSDLGVNDTLPLTHDFPLPDHEVKRPPRWAVEARSVLRFSAVYRLLSRLLRPGPPPLSSTARQRVPPEQHAENISQIQLFGSARGFRVLVLNQFRVDLHGSGRSQCLFAEEGVEPRVDLCELWRELDNRAAQYFVDPIHANPAGHQLIAERILARLLELGWVSAAPPGANPATGSEQGVDKR